MKRCRQAALHSVSVRCDKKAIPQLLTILETGTPHNRRAAAETLGRIGGSSAIPAVLERHGAQHPTVVGALAHLRPDRNRRSRVPKWASRATTAGPAGRVALPWTRWRDRAWNRPRSPRPFRQPIRSLQEAAWWIAGRHPEWAETLGQTSSRPSLPPRTSRQDERTDLVNQLAKLARSPAIQSSWPRQLRDDSASQR